MYSSAYDYHPARSLDDAHRLLAAHPGAKLLAGGHSLIPLLKLRLAAPPAVIDIGRIPELRGITISGDTLRIGALTTHAELSRSAEVKRAAPALAEAASIVGDPAVRNRGTIGGNAAHADPASDLPIVLAALEARFHTIGPRGRRTIEAAAFFTGIMATDLADDEILSAIEISHVRAGESSAYVKFTHPASRYAVIGAAASVQLSGGICTAVRAAIGGLVSHARRLPSVERALQGQALNQNTLAAAAIRAGDDLGDDVTGDIFASADYRRAMAPVYVKRALAAAAARATA